MKRSENKVVEWQIGLIRPSLRVNEEMIENGGSAIPNAT